MNDNNAPPLSQEGISIIDKTAPLAQAPLRTNNPRYIIVHATRSYPAFDDLEAYHKRRGFVGVGYHLFVDRSETVYQARRYSQEGAHALGFNFQSIGLSFYTPNGTLSNPTREMGRHLIQSLKQQFPIHEVLSHTAAQLYFFNQQLQKAGFDFQLPIPTNVHLELPFVEMKRKIDQFVGSLSTDSRQWLKENMKGFKNCPGPLFEDFLGL